MVSARRRALAAFPLVALVAGGLVAGVALGEPNNGLKKNDNKSKQGSQPATTPEKAATLKVGSAAPKLEVDSWVKGSSVKSFEAGKVYVVEFWATWCGPCKKCIPHMTELQSKYGEKVTIIGVAGSERKEKNGGDTRLANLKKFVAEQGAAMEYTVAYDGDGDALHAWMDAAGAQGIPHAFVVGHDGKIAFIGLAWDVDKALEAAVKAAEKAQGKSEAKPDATKPTASKDAKKSAH